MQRFAWLCEAFDMRDKIDIGAADDGDMGDDAGMKETLDDGKHG